MRIIVIIHSFLGVFSICSTSIPAVNVNFVRACDNLIVESHFRACQVPSVDLLKIVDELMDMGVNFINHRLDVTGNERPLPYYEVLSVYLRLNINFGRTFNEYEL